MKAIEDMTLGEIKGLKENIADELRTYLKGLAEIVSKSFDVGAIGFSVDTKMDRVQTENFDTIVTPVYYDIGIHFSKED